MAGIKRSPRLENLDLMYRATDIPKSEWVEMYIDLYTQVFGEDKSQEEAMQDAEKRRHFLFGKSAKKR